MKKALKSFAVFALALLLLGGCVRRAPKEPEVGHWHAECRLSDNRSGMSDEDYYLTSMLSGDVVFEVDLYFDSEGEFSYEVDTEKLKESMSASMGAISGLILGFDLTPFIDNLMDSAFREAMPGFMQSMEGTYTKEGDVITAVTDDGQSLIFHLENRKIVQMNGDEVFLKFSKKR